MNFILGLDVTMRLLGRGGLTVPHLWRAVFVCLFCGCHTCTQYHNKHGSLHKIKPEAPSSSFRPTNSLRVSQTLFFMLCVCFFFFFCFSVPPSSAFRRPPSLSCQAYSTVHHMWKVTKLHLRARHSTRNVSEHICQPFAFQRLEIFVFKDSF